MAGQGGANEVSGSVLLSWHEKVSRFIRCPGSPAHSPVQLTEIAGVGCIVRVMTDRRVL